MNAPVSVDYGTEEAAMQAYLAAGEKRAFSLGNRGPIRFTADGRVHPDILEAYWRIGFYVFENVLGAAELADIEADIKNILDRLPVAQGALVDAKGRPALGAGNKAPTLFWAKPLGDPFGGTEAAGGRHPVKMFEPVAADGGEINLDRSISQARLSPVSAAHLMVAIARHWGVPARIAAGLNIDPGLVADQKGEVDLKSADGRTGEGRLLDRSAIWAEIFLPDAEWVGFDPLAGSLIGLGHVKMAVGRDQRDLPRIKHVFKGDAEVELTTAISLGAIDTADGEADEALLDRSLSQISGDDRPQRKRPAHLQAAQQQQQQQ